MARRGWAVTVLDADSQPASGASSLPAGLLVPHTSPDDSPLSRLSRAGVRITLQQARAALKHGTDWGHTGVLQRDMDGDSLNLPPAWALDVSQAAADWCYSASPKALAAAGLPPDSPALWHRQAGWVKPAALVRAWLVTPGIEWRGGAKVTQLKPSVGGWQVLDAAGDLLAEAGLVVLSAGYASQALAAVAGAVPPDLQAIRGQVTIGLQRDSDALPPFPVNGHGGLIPAITTPDGPLWLMGASYERDAEQPAVKQQDHSDNLARLQTLLPQAADALTGQFSPEHAQGWAGIRCATPNRLPLVMPLAAAGLWLCTGMGSRGLSFAALCGELLAAQLHGEPLPLERRLAQAMRQVKQAL
jgi:tRNA 5-methylaminomethyl-2-thiouridine biosynthesis bifunctional protein